MNLRSKLFAIVLFVGLVPLIVSTLTGLRIHQQAFDAQIVEMQRASAEHVAAIVQQRLDRYTQSLALFSQQVVRWPELSTEERDGALWLVYRQVDEVAAAVLLDAEGKPLGAGAWKDPEDRGPELARHPGASPELLDAFRARFNGATAASRVTIGRAFAAKGLAAPLVPIAIPVAGSGTGKGWTVLVGLSLASVCADLESASRGALEVLLLDEAGRLMCRTERGTLAEADPALVGRLTGSGGAADYLDGAGNEMVAAFARLQPGWAVVSRQPRTLAFAASRRMKAQSAFWIALSLGIAVLCGGFLAKGVVDPVKRLEAGARAVAGGQLDLQLPVEGGDELARLAEAFNHMSREIGKRDAEIRAWNLELQKRVEERTEELRRTRDQLLQSQKIAAVTSLGAGIAHEMNSPLTSILGMAQTLLMRAKKRKDAEPEPQLLAVIEHEAQRLRGIIQTFIGISSNYGGQNFTRLKVNDVVEDALASFLPKLKEHGVEIERLFASGNPLILGERPQLLEALGQIFENSRIAMMGRPSPKLTLTTSTTEGGQLIKLSVTDTGRGISPENLEKIFNPFFTTKDSWRGQGLGLTVAYRVVQRHHGTIQPESKQGEGTTVTITLPAATASSHLV